MVKKHIGILEVKGREFKIKCLPLMTVRQFYMEDIVLSNHINPSDKSASKKAEDFCAEKVEQYLSKAGTCVCQYLPSRCKSSTTVKACTQK